MAQQESINRQNILTANLESEKRLHQLAKREEDSHRSLLADTPLDHLKKLKSRGLIPFVQARLCTSSTSHKLPSAVGTSGKVKAADVIQKLIDDPDYIVPSNEESLLVMA